jgi:hypothetical protein
VPPAGFAGTGTVPLLEALPPGAGEVVVCWAKVRPANAITKTVTSKIFAVFMARIVQKKLEIRK